MTVDEIEQWRETQDRVIGLVADLDEGGAARPVPACPGWTVRDLLAHMVGLGADVLVGAEPDDHHDEWTQGHVDLRAGRDVATIVAEWQTLTGPLSDWMRAHGTRPLTDVVVHEHDLRGALDAPGAEDSEGLATVRDRMAERFGARVADDGLPSIVLVSPTWECTVGDGPVAVSLAASPFDLFRALVSRRSARQIGSWVVDGDVAPYLTAFATVGPLPEHDLAV